MIRATEGMRALGFRFDLILTSPLVRARETARIVAQGVRPRPSIKTLLDLSASAGALPETAGVPPCDDGIDRPDDGRQPRVVLSTIGAGRLRVLSRQTGIAVKKWSGRG